MDIRGTATRVAYTPIEFSSNATVGLGREKVVPEPDPLPPRRGNTFTIICKSRNKYITRPVSNRIHRRLISWGSQFPKQICLDVDFGSKCFICCTAETPKARIETILLLALARCDQIQPLIVKQKHGMAEMVDTSQTPQETSNPVAAEDRGNESSPVAGSDQPDTNAPVQSGRRRSSFLKGLKFRNRRSSGPTKEEPNSQKSDEPSSTEQK